ncbi:DUF4760 domain-containing protein [Streptomyces fructofermentans]|uniref:DUF4760 domain-containing protein n=1 Tax=Streptomyces fructofermentans TaxID=152141 RepID=UPI001672AAA5|nr:hypothetical protein [Streptomyces fructofermentans]
MDPATWLNVLAVAISVTAVVASMWFGARQVRIAQHANHLPAFMELLAEFRDPRMHEQYAYVCSELGRRHSPDNGLRGLPPEARTAVYSIAYFFQTLAGMYAVGVIDETTAVIMVRGRAAKVWSAIEPYVERERQYPDVDPDLLSLLQAFARISATFHGPTAEQLLAARRRRAARGLPLHRT